MIGPQDSQCLDPLLSEWEHHGQQNNWELLDIPLLLLLLLLLLLTTLIFRNEEIKYTKDYQGTFMDLYAQRISSSSSFLEARSCIRF